MRKPLQTISPTRLEWPSWLLLTSVYSAWLLLVSNYSILPGAAILLVITNTLHGSLQHQFIHGHPTPWPWLNALLVYPPLSLWYPYPLYRNSHIQHHQNESITLPGLDPESYYISRKRWSQSGLLHRKLLIFNMTLTGRMLIGPALTLTQLIRQAVQDFRSIHLPAITVWLVHFALISSLLFTLSHYAHIPVWQYVLIAYASQSLSMLRSFFEHRAVSELEQRTVLLEASLPMRLLFTNNNYHLLHHQQPELAWYRLPDVYREQREELLRCNGGFLVKGYWEWWKNYLFTPVDHPCHPFYCDVAAVEA